MQRKLAILLVTLALVFTSAFALTGSALVSTAHAQQPPRAELLTDIPVTGTVPGGVFEGILSITELALNQDGDLVVSGVLEGTTTIGGVVTEITQEFSAVLAGLTNNETNRCDILFLDLGPIFLDVLGLEVDLSQIVLDIDAVSGPGKLLGNLLCGVVRILDGGGPIQNLIRLLDRINDLLG